MNHPEEVKQGNSTTSPERFSLPHIYIKILTGIGLILILVVAVILTTFQSQKTQDLRSIAAETNLTVRVKGVKKTNYSEQKATSPIKIKRQVNINTISKRSTRPSSPLPITGQWQGKTVKIVPNDRFYLDEKYFKEFGVYGIRASRDNRIFVGGDGAFITRSANDANWESLQLTVWPPEFNLPYLAIEQIEETSQQNSNIYMKGLHGVIKLKSDGMLEEVVSPYDPDGHLANLIRLVPYGNNGMVGYRSTEIYYMENETIRKWLTPKPDPLQSADQIRTMFQDLTEGNNTTFYGIVYHCNAVGKVCTSWSDILYQYVFSSNPNEELIVTQLGTINDWDGSRVDGIDQTQIQNRQDNPTKKILYSGVKNGTNIRTINDFDPSYQYMTFLKTVIPGRYGGNGNMYDYTIENKLEGDILWLSAAINVYKVSGFDTVGAPSFQFLTSEELDLLANHFPQTSTIDSFNNIYMGHEYEIENSQGLITIFEDGLPVSNSPPKILDNSLPSGKVGVPYAANVEGLDNDQLDVLSMTANNLPTGLSLRNCTSKIVLKKSTIKCTVVGIPTQSDTKKSIFSLSDDHGGVDRKILSISIVP